MGRTALYRDPETPPRAELQLDADTLWLRSHEGRIRRYPLHGCAPTILDGCLAGRFVRMLVLDPETAIITPPDRGAIAPRVVVVPEAPATAWIVEPGPWTVLADWLDSGGRLGAFSVADLARLATVATSAFATIVGEVAAERALEQVWAARGPLRGGTELESALWPFAEAARHSPRAADALVAAFAHAAGLRRRRCG